MQSRTFGRCKGREEPFRRPDAWGASGRTPHRWNRTRIQDPWKGISCCFVSWITHKHSWISVSFSWSECFFWASFLWPRAYADFEKKGMEQVSKLCFCLVAGGLGERLGYPGIKIGITAELTSGILPFVMKQHVQVVVFGFCVDSCILLLLLMFTMSILGPLRSDPNQHPHHYYCLPSTVSLRESHWCWFIYMPIINR